MSARAPVESLLEVRELAVTYNPSDWNERQVLDNVGLSVAGGDFVVLSGPNGSGKSSLLRALSGDLPRARVQGNAQLNGEPLLGMSPIRRARLVAVIDQDPTQGTCEHLLVREQLLLAGREVERRVAERLAHFGSTVDLGQRVQSLSGGQRQLLAVLIAVERGTPLLLADEPTAALDPHFASFVLELLLERRGDPRFATLMVSHQGQLKSDAPGTRRIRLVERRLVEGAED